MKVDEKINDIARAQTVKSEEGALDDDRLLWQGLQNPSRGWLFELQEQAGMQSGG